MCGGWRAGGAALGFRQFRYLVLCKSEPVEGLAVLALALAHLLKSTKAAGGTSAGRLNQGMTQLLTHDSLILSLTLHN